MSRYYNTAPQILTKNKVAISGAKKFFFELGTTTKKTIYSDPYLTIAIDNPQLSDADGRYSTPIFLDGLYKEEQQDNEGTPTGYDGNTLWTDPVVGSLDSVSLPTWISSTTYNIPDIVIGSDNAYYISITDTNQGNDPTSSPSNWSLISFIKAGVADGVTTINDSNGNKALGITATANAVNNPVFVNAATGNNPSINVEGEDVPLNVEGVTLKNGDVSATTINKATIPVYGMVILDTPEEIVGTITEGSWQTVNSTTLSTAAASKAILRVVLRINDASSTAVVGSIFIRKTGSALATSDLTLAAQAVEYTNTASLITAIACSEVTVNLDTSYDFDYYMATATGADDGSAIILVGYYV